MRIWLGGVLVAVGAGFIGEAAQAQPAPESEQRPVLLEGVTVVGTRDSANPPPYEAQQDRFLRRPGAETVVSVTDQDPGPQGNLRDVLQHTPGIYAPDRGAGSSGMISMRGSDIDQTGSRGGRGVRAYLDGIPLGRTESGLTNALIDLKAADYVEVYRGASSLRYGAIATGGALNLVSKTGRSAPRTSISGSLGAFDFRQAQFEHGNADGPLDWYGQVNTLENDGFQDHTREENQRFSGNVGWQPAGDVENRTFLAVGRTRQELGGSVALNRLRDLRKNATNDSVTFNARVNFDYQRLANRTVLRRDSGSYELSVYALHTKFDHLPVPQAGIVDNTWNDFGTSFRSEHRADLFGLPTELVAGTRLNYEGADFRRYRHSNGGTEKSTNVAHWDFGSWLAETYGEAAIEVLPRVKTFAGLQAVFTTRDLDDVYSGPNVIAATQTQPGRSAGRQQYERDFSALNPKLGVNWEYAPTHYLFGSVARSYEVPGGGDLSNLLSAQASSGITLPTLKAQSAWTWETGFRGGPERLQYDVTFYHMRLRDEILTRCATEISASNCSGTNQIAFNADRTTHNGIEAGLRTVPFIGLLVPDDKVILSTIWNYTDFRFDGDSRFGDRRLPVIPEHQIMIEPGYRLAGGFYAAANVRFLSERQTTFDGSGGDEFVVSSQTLYGAKLGWNPPDGNWGLWAEGRNLTDKAYAGDLSPAPRAIGTSPTVTPGDGRAFYVGASLRW